MSAKQFHVGADGIPNDLHGLLRRRVHMVVPDDVKRLGFAFKQRVADPEFATPRYDFNNLSTFCEKRAERDSQNSTMRFLLLILSMGVWGGSSEFKAHCLVNWPPLRSRFCNFSSVALCASLCEIFGYKLLVTGKEESITSHTSYTLTLTNVTSTAGPSADIYLVMRARAVCWMTSTVSLGDTTTL